MAKKKSGNNSQGASMKARGKVPEDLRLYEKPRLNTGMNTIQITQKVTKKTVKRGKK